MIKYSIKLYSFTYLASLGFLWGDSFAPLVLIRNFHSFHTFSYLERGLLLDKFLIPVFVLGLFVLGGLSGKVKLPDGDKLENDLPPVFGVVISAEPLPVAEFDRNLLLLRLLLLLSHF